MIGGCFSQLGHEAISVVAAMALQPADVIAPMHRDLKAYLVRGITPRRMLVQHFGRATGVSHGRDTNLHGCGDLSLNIVGFVSMLPASMPVIAGVAHALRLKGEPRVAAPDTPVPYSPPLEDAYRPNAARILKAARELLAY
jgi:pyruvate dehydrogenase E1 component alpha subunit